jgi:hypothetical protein
MKSFLISQWLTLPGYYRHADSDADLPLMIPTPQDPGFEHCVVDFLVIVLIGQASQIHCADQKLFFYFHGHVYLDTFVR